LLATQNASSTVLAVLLSLFAFKFAVIANVDLLADRLTVRAGYIVVQTALVREFSLHSFVTRFAWTLDKCVFAILLHVILKHRSGNRSFAAQTFNQESIQLVYDNFV
jgi:hypothetical protein